jgi:hypothetical protein
MKQSLARPRRIEPHRACGSGQVANLISCPLRDRQEIADHVRNCRSQFQHFAAVAHLARVKPFPDGSRQRGHLLRLTQGLAHDLAILFRGGGLEQGQLQRATEGGQGLARARSPSDETSTALCSDSNPFFMKLASAASSSATRIRIRSI